MYTQFLSTIFLAIILCATFPAHTQAPPIDPDEETVVGVITNNSTAETSPTSSSK